MKKSIFIFFLLLSCESLFGQTFPPEYEKLIFKAESLYRANDFKNSALKYSSAFKTLEWRAIPTGGYTEDCYGAARSWALVNNPDSAFFYLERIVKKLSFTDSARITGEESFKSLHTDPRWKPLIDLIKPPKLAAIPSSTFMTYSSPKGWLKAGSSPNSYVMYVDTVTRQYGKNAATIKSFSKTIDGFGTLMQNCMPGKYAGKRIRMTGYMKSKDVTSWAGFWLRMDQSGSEQSLMYFDNMHDRPIRETTDWKEYEIVLDVPADAINIAFGALLNGTGQIWFDNLKFEIVDRSVPTTNSTKSVNGSDEPVNLDFEK